MADHEGGVHFQYCDQLGTSVFTDEESEDCDRYLSVLLANRALAYLRQGKATAAVADCELAVELDQCNVKAFYRLGCALRETGDLERALENLEEAERLVMEEEGVKTRSKEIETAIEECQILVARQRRLVMSMSVLVLVLMWCE